MLKMASQIDNIVNAYKTLSTIPSILSGKLNNAGNRVTAKWSVRNLDKGKTTKYTTNYILDESLSVLAQSEFGSDVSNELLSTISPRETYKAIIREEDSKVRKQYLEVWKKSTLAHCIDLTTLDLHGDVYADSEFGSLEWSPDETAIVYVAERKPRKTEPYIKRKAEEKAKGDGNGEVPKKGEEFLYRQDWGEQLVGKISSVVVMCTLRDEKVAVLNGVPEDLCVGQVRFTPDGSGVVGVAWRTQPRRLGLIYCTNRPGVIFSLTLDGVLTEHTGQGLAVRSPRCAPGGALLWLQRAAGGPHHAAHQMWRMRTGSKEADKVPVIDIIETETRTANGEPFYGLYSHALPARCFSSDGARVVFSTPQRNEVRSYVKDLESGDIVDISIRSSPGSTSVLDVKSDVVLASYSNLTTPAQLYVARLPPRSSEASIQWVRVSEPLEPPPSVAAARAEYLQLEHEDSSDDVKSFSAIYFAPKTEEGKKLPLIVWPHGGPHSNFVNSFALETSLFNMLGFASVRCNYRGSTGAGAASARCLVGHVGEYDVADCRLALTTLLERDSTSHVVLYGGSYGGLVVGHLAARHPHQYKAMVMRNPLIDLATKGHYADNSDGCAVEAGFEFTERGPASEEQLVAMRRCSPLARVQRVRAPTALALGGADRRVPPHQGLEYARRLKANGVETRVYMYDDNHSLSTLPAEMDNLINSADWFLTHLQE